MLNLPRLCGRVRPLLGSRLPAPRATLHRCFHRSPASLATVEKTYVKKSAREHVLLRPGMYIGSSAPTAEAPQWAFDPSDARMKQEALSYVPGLVKLFDEILVNAVDNAVRDKTQDRVEVTIKEGDGVEPPTITVYNNGSGIPVQLHKTEGVYIPELVLGHLLTGSNFDDTQELVTGGRHGYGAKLTNIFSKVFTVETVDPVAGKKYRQTWSNNMKMCEPPEISPAEPGATSYTCVSFSPDVNRFGLDRIDAGSAAVMRRRVVDAAGTVPGVAVVLDGHHLKVPGFQEYMKLYPPAGDGNDAVVTYRPNKRWEMGFAASTTGHQAISFVNGINTLRGGTHVAAVADQVCKPAAAMLTKKLGTTISPVMVKNHLRVFVNCQVPSPSFDAQAKEKLVTHGSDLGIKFSVPDRIVKEIVNTLGVGELVASTVRSRDAVDVMRQVRKGKRSSQLRAITKLEDANDAGGRRRSECTLILTEGDSAKALAVAGLSVVGRDKYGVFPLRGKVLNVRDLTPKSAMENTELANLVAILGLDFNCKYDKPEDIAKLRYGRVMIMADQDTDGSHIKGLIINMFHRFFPNLVQHPGFLQQFVTPIIKATKGKTTKEFFNVSSYTAWRESEEGQSSGWRTKYYKGLGTSTAAEGRSYFSDLDTHQRTFSWGGDDDNDAIDKAFAKSRVEDRKTWLLAPAPPQESHGDATFSEFINQELVEFSRADLVRSIPSAIDGLKPSQRKVLYAAMRRGSTSEVKVAQLAGYCAEHTAYHHGEASLVATIVKMAQDYVGSNNLPLLLPIGQFGTRALGGKDAASARYIFTKTNPITRLLFPAADDDLLEYVEDDGQRVEPVTYVPIVPLALVNGSEGIGTGWSTFVPSFNPLEIVDVLLHRLGVHPPATPPPGQLHPWYNGFKGSVVPSGALTYTTSGTAEQDGRKVRITELPVGRWTDDFKASLVRLMDKGVIDEFKEYHTVTDVDFLVRMSKAGEDALDTASPETLFKMRKPLKLSNMHMFDGDARIKRYSSAEEVMEGHFPVRLALYCSRREAGIGALEASVAQLGAKARFVQAVISDSIKLSTYNKADLEVKLGERGFVPMPRAAGGKPSFDYLLGLPLSQLTSDAVAKALSDVESTTAELDALRQTTAEELWSQELLAFRQAVAGALGEK